MQTQIIRQMVLIFLSFFTLLTTGFANAASVKIYNQNMASQEDSPIDWNSCQIETANPTGKSDCFSHEDSTGISLLGFRANGGCKTLDNDSSIIYLNNGPYLEIIDISNPWRPFELSRLLLPGSIRKIVAKYPCLYIMTSEYNVCIIDISDPKNPKLVSNVNISEGIGGIAGNDSILFIGNSAGMWIINVTIPAAPRKVGYLFTNTALGQFALGGQYVYILEFYEGDMENYDICLSFDITSPRAPRYLGGWCFSHGRHKMRPAPARLAASQEYAGVIHTEYYQREYEMSMILMNTFRIDSTGRYRSTIHLPSDVEDFQIYGNHAFLMEKDSLRIMNLAAADSPKTVSILNIPAGKITIAEHGQILCVAAGTTGVRIINIENVERPHEISFFNFKKKHTPGLMIYDLCIYQSYAYLAAGTLGLLTFDISQPNQPVRVDRRQPEVFARRVLRQDDFLFLSDDKHLRIFSLADPQKPVEVNRYTMKSTIQEIAISGRHLYLLAQEGLQIVDIQEAWNPKAVPPFHSIDGPQKIVVQQNRAYIICQDGLRTFDVSNPSALREMSLFTPSDQIINLAVNGTRLFLLENEIYLRVVDFSDAENPVELGRFNAEGYGNDIVIRDNLAFIADSRNGARVIDVTAPNHLQEVGVCSAQSTGTSISVDDNRILLTTHIGGFYIYKFAGNVPTSPDLLQPSPNSHIAQNFPEFKWSVSNPLQDTLYFKIELSNDSSFSRQLRKSPYESYLDATGFSLSGTVVQSTDTCSFIVPDTLPGIPHNEYFWRVTTRQGKWYGKPSDVWKFTFENYSDVKLEQSAPQQFDLLPNYPNPFNLSTTIQYTLPHSSPVIIRIFNIRGELVKTVTAEKKRPGIHSIIWQAVNEEQQPLSSGIYFCRFTAGQFTKHRKMIIIK